MRTRAKIPWDPEFPTHSSQCRECGGTGKSSGQECGNCDATGTLFFGFRQQAEGACVYCEKPSKGVRNDDGDVICRGCMVDLHEAECGCARWFGSQTGK